MRRILYCFSQKFTYIHIHISRFRHYALYQLGDMLPICFFISQWRWNIFFYCTALFPRRRWSPTMERRVLQSYLTLPPHRHLEPNRYGNLVATVVPIQRNKATNSSTGEFHKLHSTCTSHAGFFFCLVLSVFILCLVLFLWISIYFRCCLTLYQSNANAYCLKF